MVRADLDRLARRTVERIVETSEFYRDSERIPYDDLVAYVRENIEYLLDHDSEDDVCDDASQPRRTGREHALRGIPLPDVLAAYRIGFAFLWDAITRAILDTGTVSHQEVIDAATEMWWRADHFGHAVTEAHRDATTEILLRQEHERSAMVEALITGTVADNASLWDTAGRLGLPHEGHFVVVVADSPTAGRDPLPGIAGRLRELDTMSVWRLAPHQSIGVLSLPEPDTTLVGQCLEQCAEGPIGVSPLFGRLDRAPRAFYLAGIAARSRPSSTAKVRVFTETPIAVLVAASPDAAAAAAADVLGRVLALPAQERDVLLDTFDVWVDSGGSVSSAGTRLFCHPNTVRYRLRKLSELTGRATDSPAGLGELAVAVQAWRLVGDADRP